MASAIIIVDMQNDFVEGGALAVAGGLALVPRINEYVAANPHMLVVTTQDWHPADHSQFIPNGGRWPVHCVEHTHGAMWVDGLCHDGLNFVLKGAHRLLDGYSGFEGVQPNTGRSLEEILIDNEVKTVYVCGIAFDYCVKATCLDAVKAGFKTYLLCNLIVGVSPETIASAETELAQAGVVFMTTPEEHEASAR